MLPPGWTAINQAGLDAANELLKRSGVGGDIRYTHGFTQDPAGNPRPPFFMIQLSLNSALRDASYEDVQRMIAKGFEQAPSSIKDMKDVSGVNSNVGAAPKLNRESNSASFDISIQGQGAVLRTFSWMFLGRDRIVQMNFYALESNLETDKPLFTQIAGSFRFDEGRQFVPSSGGPIRAYTIGYVLGRLAIPVLALGVTAAAVFIVVRRRAARASG